MSTLVIDTIQGKTTAGSVNVRGENSNNTNLQQGLAKAWQNHNSSSVNDSFNASSFTDNATGDFTINFGNDFSSANHCCGHIMGADGSDNFADTRNRSTDSAAGSMRYVSGYNDSSVNDWTHNELIFHGDLA